MALHDLNTVLSCLPKLGPEELQTVRKKVSANLSLCGGATVSAPSFNFSEPDYLFDAIKAELRRRGQLKRDGGIAASQVPSAYQSSASEVRQLLKQHVGDISAREYAALGMAAIRALASYLERGRVPVSAKTLMLNVSKVPLALDDAYPGYLEAGLLSFCWRK